MKVIKISLLQLFLLVSSCAFAQGDTIKNVSEVKTVPAVVTTVINVDSLLKVISDKQKEIKEKQDSIQQLMGEVQQKDLQIRILKDSLGKYNKDSIDQILEQANLVIVRISSDCLRKPYNKADVDAAIARFGEMFTPYLQEKFEPVKKLLQNYEAYTQGIRDVFTEADNDKHTASLAHGKSVAMQYETKLKNTQYCKDVYNNKNPWYIPYLSDVVKKALDRIANFNPSEGNSRHQLKLSDLLQ